MSLFNVSGEGGGGGSRAHKLDLLYVPHGKYLCQPMLEQLRQESNGVIDIPKGRVLSL